MFTQPPIVGWRAPQAWLDAPAISQASDQESSMNYEENDTYGIHACYGRTMYSL